MAVGVFSGCCICQIELHKRNLIAMNLCASSKHIYLSILSLQRKNVGTDAKTSVCNNFCKNLASLKIKTEKYRGSDFLIAFGLIRGGNSSIDKGGDTGFLDI